MPYRTWLLVFALGLTPLSLQAQEQTQSAQSPATEQQGQPEDPPFSIPFRIIESNEASIARQREKAETRQREIDDLVAQQGMNEATHAMNEATQSMMRAAWVSTGLVGLGTALLIWTLKLTRQANNAALATVAATEKFGVAQNRPYVQVEPEGAYSHWDDANNNAIYWRIRVRISNSGITPALSMTVKTCWRLEDGDITLIKMPEETKPIKTYIRGGKSVCHLEVIITGEALWRVRQGETRLFIFTEALYGTGLDQSARYITRHGAVAASVTGDPRLYWDENNPVVITWGAIPTYCCFDDECSN